MVTTRTPIELSRSEDNVLVPLVIGVAGGLAGLAWFLLLSFAKGAKTRITRQHYFIVFGAAAVAGARGVRRHIPVAGRVELHFELGFCARRRVHRGDHGNDGHSACSAVAGARVAAPALGPGKAQAVEQLPHRAEAQAGVDLLRATIVVGHDPEVLSLLAAAMAASVSAVPMPLPRWSRST